MRRPVKVRPVKNRSVVTGTSVLLWRRAKSRSIGAMKTRHFRDLLVWQHAMKLARCVYEVVRDFPKEEIFGLSSQIRRAAVSIPSNIAEGHGRTTRKGFAVFLAQARGSLNELETQLELAENLGYLTKSNLQQLLTESAEVGRMLNGLLRTLQQSEVN